MEQKELQAIQAQPLDARPAPQMNPVIVYLSTTRSRNTRRAMGRALDRIADLLTGGALEDQRDAAGRVIPGAKAAQLGARWGDVRYQHVAALRAELIQRYSAATVNLHLSALRGVLKEAWRLEYLSAEMYHRAVDVENVEQTSLPAGRDVSLDELERLIEVCQRDLNRALGLRDIAAFALLYTGLRRSEIVALTLDRFDRSSGKITILESKRDKDRTTYLDANGMQALEDWLEVRGDWPGPLLVPVGKSGRVEVRQRHLSAQAVYDLVKVRQTEAGIDPATPHDFRRSVIGDLLDAKVDIATVAQMMGQSDINTTKRYDRRPERAKQQAARRLHLPYTRLEHKEDGS